MTPARVLQSLESGILSIRVARRSDMRYIHRLEHDPRNSPFISPESKAAHIAALKTRGTLQLILESLPDRRRAGFVILRRWPGRDGNLELKRIVVDAKGRGFGREALRLIKTLAFDRLGVHRLELDVKDFNRRAKKLYLSEGFSIEGTLRECLKLKGRRGSVILMSILRKELRPSKQG
jgi:diamine N-acetyltransferase